VVVEQPLELLDELRAQKCRPWFTLFRWRTVTPFRFRHSQHAFPASRAELAAHGRNRRRFAFVGINADTSNCLTFEHAFILHRIFASAKNGN